MKKKINNKFGIVFWITGLSGSGKSSLAKKIYPQIKKNFGPTIIIHGDEFRKIFNLNGYSKNDRFEIGKKYSNFCKVITKQKINIIFAVVGLFHSLHSYNKRIHKNYVEIFIKSNIDQLKDMKKKMFYKKKTKNVWGIDLMPEFPKNPDVILNNKFDKTTTYLSKQLLMKINKLILN